MNGTTSCNLTISQKSDTSSSFFVINFVSSMDAVLETGTSLVFLRLACTSATFKSSQWNIASTSIVNVQTRVHFLGERISFGAGLSSWRWTLCVLWWVTSRRGNWDTAISFLSVHLKTWDARFTFLHAQKKLLAPQIAIKRPHLSNRSIVVNLESGHSHHSQPHLQQDCHWKHFPLHWFLLSQRRDFSGQDRFFCLHCGKVQLNTDNCHMVHGKKCDLLISNQTHKHAAIESVQTELRNCSSAILV